MDFPTEGLVLKRSASSSVGRIQELKMKGIEYEVNIKPTFCVSETGTLFSAHDNNIYSHQLGSTGTVMNSFSLNKYSFDMFADSAIQHLLRLDEKITVSSFINTDGWPKYLIGTNKGKLYIVPTTSNATIASFEYHQASVTCIFSTEEILVTASKDKTLCVWPLNVINEIEKQHGITENRNRSRTVHDPRRRSVRLTNTPHTDLDVPDFTSTSELIHIKPQHLFTIEEGFVKSICNVTILKDTVEQVDASVWDSKWESWKNTLLLQLRDGTLILVSLITNATVCRF
jgi:hypothetical protein